MRDNDTADIQDGMRVVGEATNQAEAFQAAQKTAPDIFILDLDLRAENGLDFLPKLISSFPAARVIVLTSSTEIEAHQRAVQSGAMGLVLKEQGAEVLIAAIEKVHSGEAWLARSRTVECRPSAATVKSARTSRTPWGMFARTPRIAPSSSIRSVTSLCMQSWNLG